MKSTIKTLIIAFIGGLTFFVAEKIYNQQQTTINREVPVINHIPVSSARYTGATPKSFSDIAEKNVNCVVHVKTYFASDIYKNPLFDFFFGESGKLPDPVLSAGSGVIISNDGFIVTNNHVISRTEKIEVVLNDRRSFIAKVIGTDPATDLALLKIDCDSLPNMKFGNSDEIRIGEWALAIGNPFNLTSTVTAGIISAKARNINMLNEEYAIESFIQTDAAVNPGNSGGALINDKGELIGINTAIASQNGSFIGYSFAVPASIAKKVVKDLIEYGTVQRALLGIAIRDLDAEKAAELHLEKIEGVYIMEVTDKGAAKEAGIIKGDIITFIEDIKISKSAELQEQIGKYRPGDRIKITISRAGEVKDVFVTLRNKQGNTDLIESEIIDALGARFENITEKDKEEFEINFGVKIIEIKPGKLLKAGVDEGFIITKINRQPIHSIDDMKVLLKEVNGGVYIEGIDNDGTTRYFAFGINSN